MSRLSSAFVLGYHGCPVSVAEKVLRNQPFKASSNDYDWLGPGVYFWEANPRRGLEYFRHLSERKRLVEEGVVVGAIIDLGYCLDLTSSMGVIAVRAAYESYLAFSTAAGLAKVDPALFSCFQICDAPLLPQEDVRREARYGRVYPGEGELPLADILSALPAGIPVSVETPTESRKDVSLADRAREVARRTSEVLATAAPGGDRST